MIVTITAVSLVGARRGENVWPNVTCLGLVLKVYSKVQDHNDFDV